MLVLLLFGCCVSTQISKKNQVIVIIINFYVCMYVYCPFWPHIGITIENVHILFSSPVNANFFFLELLLIYCHYIECHVLYLVL
jgi:hypothetical protein